MSSATPVLKECKDGPVRAIMFTQFEDVEGYVVAASDPPNVMTDQFKEIGYQFLPDKDICWRLISLCVGEYRIVGVPVHIDDAKYARRAFVFCFCLIVEKQAMELGKIVAQYLAEIFYKLEVDSSFLSGSPAGKEALPIFLKDLRDSLNSDKIDSVNLEVVDGFRLQFCKPRKPLGSVADHLLKKIEPWFVPVATVGVDDLGKVASAYDLVEVMQECTGESSVSEISLKLGIEYADLIRALSVLEERRLIVVIDQPIDTFSRLRLTNAFHAFFDDLSNRQAAVAFASQVCSVVSSPRGGGSGPPPGDVGDQLVRVYCRLDGHVEDLGEFDSAQSSGLSTRLLAMFGIIKGFIRPKTMFPVHPDHETTMIPVLRSCDGSKSWDEIGFKHGLHREELNELFSYHGVFRIWR